MPDDTAAWKPVDEEAAWKPVAEAPTPPPPIAPPPNPIKSVNILGHAVEAAPGPETPTQDKFATKHPILSDIIKSASIPNPEAMSAGPLAEGMGMKVAKALGSNIGKGLGDINILKPFRYEPLVNMVKGTIQDIRAPGERMGALDRLALTPRSEPPPVAQQPLRDIGASTQANTPKLEPMLPSGAAPRPAPVIQPAGGGPAFSQRLSEVRQQFGLKPEADAMRPGEYDVGTGEKAPQNLPAAPNAKLASNPKALAAAEALKKKLLK
jgi:hypothetical protein